MALIGIDLGTTNSLVSVWNGTDVQLIRNILGNTLTPSVVGLDDNSSIIVGEIAHQRRVSHPALTACEFKRTMGTDTKYKLGDREYSSEELSAYLLRKLVNDASQQLGTSITDAVISVPAYFDDNQREATKLAAQIAGINVKRLINEPSAAVLYYQWKYHNEHPDGIYIVIDFGGGTLDVSVVDCFENIIEITSIAGDNHLGGKDFDMDIALDFCNKNNIQFDTLGNATRQNILWTAENIKKTLSFKDSANMHINMGSESYETTYTPRELLKACASTLNRIKAVINSAINGADIATDEIADIILVGGSCKMPIVQKYLSALFHRNITINHDDNISDEDSIDNYVAYGTGILTGIINRNEDIRDIVMTDVCPFSLGIDTHIGDKSPLYMSTIIPKNSILPITKSARYHGLTPFQKCIGFTVYQGEEMYAASNLALGHFTIDVTPNDNGDTAIEVTFTYDINGLLEVKTRDLNGDNKLEEIIINKNSHLTEEDIRKKQLAMNMSLQTLDKDYEEIRSIMAWAERLYTQADDEYKAQLLSITNTLSTAIDNNDITTLARIKKDIFQQLLYMEVIINRNHFEDTDIIASMLDTMEQDDEQHKNEGADITHE